ncbi:MAG: hypothetical protein JGK01_01800 [Microcoleus sp. PH2017_03_ELD_O_A]|uniref:hypothetical protein n=1 Tax=unclassified Microcoleus TaxID=2642155 RepID=UPI001D999BE9|nr:MULTISPECIES: hypothetical protein [unclassified Microcoleus]MCC3435878.1 hypothetical protein [Microcoleus sp. PH2017_05_CCC_O_A]MCC3440557.1 hypothetical protein [Microcoleus sp. PH2017_03_ELD_O_A]MCC3465375.1 hypothetical protein [Microcoleus sp. PH2017_06_SFM_O_A]MCC3498556.1 hypothetical protein [Microcoleus sp. PH2017_15_JOR_U_A]MCC3567315.1 hypothetical protein [Microcoleus sp. PH2017_31_RDM_U_A]TAE14375.1 MAG: hypothetical protein EAZ94_07225 [Oscillatoriales cyanobacterium]
MIFSFDKIPNHPANMQRYFFNEPRRREGREVRDEKGREELLAWLGINMATAPDGYDVLNC